eukprot:Sdes_comp20956_c0_seq1m18688
MVNKTMRNIKNVMKSYSDIERKVRSATSNDPWGATGTQMAYIADCTYNNDDFPQIMNMIWKRMNDSGKNWRHVYKSLVLLEYIIKTGSERVVLAAEEHAFAIQTLKNFQFIDSEGKDQGLNVREKAKAVVLLINNKDLLKEERDKANIIKDRLITPNARFQGNNTAGRSNVAQSNHSTHRHDNSPRGNINSPYAASPTGISDSGYQIRPQGNPAHLGVTERLASDEQQEFEYALSLSRQQAQEDEKKRMQVQKSEDDEIKRAIELSKLEGERNTKNNSAMIDILGSDPWGAVGTAEQRQNRRNEDDVWGDLRNNSSSSSQLDSSWGHQSNGNPQFSDERSSQKQFAYPNINPPFANPQSPNHGFGTGWADSVSLQPSSGEKASNNPWGSTSPQQTWASGNPDSSFAWGGQNIPSSNVASQNSFFPGSPTQKDAVPATQSLSPNQQVAEIAKNSSKIDEFTRINARNGSNSSPFFEVSPATTPQNPHQGSAKDNGAFPNSPLSPFKQPLNAASEGNKGKDEKNTTNDVWAKNSDLFNLDALSIQPTKKTNTNPFQMSSNISSVPESKKNPFLERAPQPPTIHQLQQRTAASSNLSPTYYPPQISTLNSAAGSTSVNSYGNMYASPPPLNSGFSPTMNAPPSMYQHPSPTPPSMYQNPSFGPMPSMNPSFPSNYAPQPQYPNSSAPSVGQPSYSQRPHQPRTGPQNPFG